MLLSRTTCKAASQLQRRKFSATVSKQVDFTHAVRGPNECTADVH